MPGFGKALEGTVDWTRGFVRRHWQRALLIRQRLRPSEEALHLLMGAGIGVIGGLTNLAYYGSHEFLKFTLLGAHGDPADIAEKMVVWQRILIPAVGGLAAGMVLYFGLRLIGNPGLSNLLEVVVAGDGRLSLRTALVNAASSLLSISSGAPVGREGLIIQLSAALSSKAGQLVKWPPYRLRLVVACGAAAGVAAGCNAPIAGAVFAAQIVLGNFSMNLFAPLVVSSVVALIVSRGFFGISQWYEAPAFDFTRLSQLPWFLLLGALAGVLGAAFLKLLRVGEALFSKVRAPLYVRLMLAGWAAGLIAVVYPNVWGNGYRPTTLLLHEWSPDLWWVVGLLVAKLLATVLSIGSGTVGGVFTPTLFLGAALGSAYGMLLHLGGFGPALPTGAFALVGMASVLAATTHSPLLAMIMVFELSWNYSLMPPLMLACALATLVARRLHTESVYTEPLRRKGLELQRESPHIGAATEKTVGDLMREPVPPVRTISRFQEVAQRFLTSPNNFLPVVDEKEHLVGVVALHDLKEYLTAGHELDSVIAYDVMRPPPQALTPSERLLDALPVLLSSELERVPVVNNRREGRLVGSVARGDALSLLSEVITARSAPKT